MKREATVYRKGKYICVHRTVSKKRANVVAHTLAVFFLDDCGEKDVVLVDRCVGRKADLYKVFVKEPYDKIIKGL